MAPSNAKTESVKLSSGHSMPLLGFGTWQNANKDLSPVEWALDAGYRHIDTAFIYFNEEIVGRDIAKWLAKDKSHKREDLFVVTKLPFNGLAPEHVERFLKTSLKRLGLDYVDLYLVHTPVGTKNFYKETGGRLFSSIPLLVIPSSTGNDNQVLPVDDKGNIQIDCGTDHIALWKTMETMVSKGLTKSIGVSNYTIGQLRRTLAHAKIPPAVNQIELHLRYQRPEIVKFCQDNGITVTSYSSLGSPGRANTPSSFSEAVIPGILNDPVVKLVADNHKVSNAQVALKFWVQQNVIVIPKSETPSRIQSNAELFDWKLSETEMAALKSLNLPGNQGKSFLVKEGSALRDHPEYFD